MKRYLLFFLIPFTTSLIIFTPHIAAAREQEGDIKTSDCREQVLVKEDSAWNSLHTFTCSYLKNSRGQIYWGECCRVEMNSNGDCLKSYCYSKNSQVVCGSNEFINNDGECMCKAGTFLLQGACQIASCPPHAFFNDATKLCSCNYPYQFDEKTKTCEPEQCVENAHFSDTDNKCICDTGFDDVSGTCLKAEAYAYNSKDNSFFNSEGQLRGVIEKSIGEDTYQFNIDHGDKWKLNNIVTFLLIPKWEASDIGSSDTGKSLQVYTSQLSYGLDGKSVYWPSDGFIILRDDMSSLPSASQNFQPSVKEDNIDSLAGIISFGIILAIGVTFVLFWRKKGKKIKT